MLMPGDSTIMLIHSSSSPSDTSTNNHPPVAHDATFTRAEGLSLKIKIADLLTGYASDPDGDVLGLESVGASLQGAEISTNGTYIFYTPVNNNPDSFSYTVSDGRGGESSATINVVVVRPGGTPQSIQVVDGVVTLNLAGIPGFEYDIEQSTNLMDWMLKATLTAPTNGLFQYIESNAPSPSSFYRLLQH